MYGAVVGVEYMGEIMTDGSVGRDEFDREHVSHRVVESVAAADGVDPIDLPPLYDAINPDALNTLFDPASTDGKSTVGELRFSYHGYDVRVTAGGVVTISSEKS